MIRNSFTVEQIIHQISNISVCILTPF